MEGKLRKPRTTGVATTLVALAAVNMSGAAQAPLESAIARLEMGLDISVLSSAGHPSWLEGSAGPLRFDSDGVFVEQQYGTCKLMPKSVVRRPWKSSGYRCGQLSDSDWEASVLPLNNTRMSGSKRSIAAQGT